MLYNILIWKMRSRKRSFLEEDCFAVSFGRHVVVCKLYVGVEAFGFSFRPLGYSLISLELHLTFVPADISTTALAFLATKPSVHRRRPIA